MSMIATNAFAGKRVSQILLTLENDPKYVSHAIMSTPGFKPSPAQGVFRTCICGDDGSTFGYYAPCPPGTSTQM